jgi:hypothetical protein
MTVSPSELNIYFLHLPGLRVFSAKSTQQVGSEARAKARL